MARQRFFRTIVVGGATLAQGGMLALICDAACSGETAGPTCNPTLTLTSPCGFESVTTTCTGGPATCTPDRKSCSIGKSPFLPDAGDAAITGDCSVSVVLGDGTQRSFDVTVAPSRVPGCEDVVSQTPNFTSATCHQPVDASDEDAADDVLDLDVDAQNDSPEE